MEWTGGDWIGRLESLTGFKSHARSKRVGDKGEERRVAQRIGMDWKVEDGIELEWNEEERMGWGDSNLSSDSSRMLAEM